MDASYYNSDVTQIDQMSDQIYRMSRKENTSVEN